MIYGHDTERRQAVSHEQLNELADRLADITEDAHGNPKPIDLSDRLEAAAILRQIARKLLAADNLRNRIRTLHTP